MVAIASRQHAIHHFLADADLMHSKRTRVPVRCTLRRSGASLLSPRCVRVSFSCSAADLPSATEHKGLILVYGWTLPVLSILRTWTLPRGSFTGAIMAAA